MDQRRWVEVRPRCPCLSHWPPLPPPRPPPISSLRLPVASGSAALGSAPLHSAQLRSRKATSSLPSSSPFSCCHHSPLIASRGWGPQGWTHPTVAPEPNWSDGHAVGHRTPEPRGGQCARVPLSLLKVSASRGCRYSGSFRTSEPTPGPSSQTSGPQTGFDPKGP